MEPTECDIKENNKFIHVEVWTRFYLRAVFMAWYLVISVVMLAQIWIKRGKIKSHNLVTRSLIWLLLAGLLDTARNIWLFCVDDYELHKDSSDGLKVIGACSEMAFFFQHWEFVN